MGFSMSLEMALEWCFIRFDCHNLLFRKTEGISPVPYQMGRQESRFEWGFKPGRVTPHYFSVFRRDAKSYKTLPSTNRLLKEKGEYSLHNCTNIRFRDEGRGINLVGPSESSHDQLL